MSIASELATLTANIASFRSAMASNFHVSLGDALNQWPTDLNRVSISGDLREFECYLRFGGKNAAVANARTNTFLCMPQVTMADIDFENTTFPYQSFYGAFCGATSLTTIPRLVKPKARKISSQPGAFFSYAFAYCSGLAGEYTFDISEACDTANAANTNIASNTFAHCTGITGVNLIWPETFVGSYRTTYVSNSFAGCTGLRWVKIRGLADDSKYIVSQPESTTFSGCTDLTSMEWTDIKQAYGQYNPAKPPSYYLASGGGSWFTTTTPNLTTVSFPSMEILNIAGARNSTIGLTSMFRNVASSLEHIYLPKCYYIAVGAFNGLNCTVHLSQSNRAALSQLDGYSDNFTWTRGDGTPSGNVTLVYDQ